MKDIQPNNIHKVPIKSIIGNINNSNSNQKTQENTSNPMKGLLSGTINQKSNNFNQKDAFNSNKVGTIIEESKTQTTYIQPTTSLNLNENKNEKTDELTNFAHIFFNILKSGILGALIFLLLVSSFIALFIFAGRLPSSQTFVSAMGIGSAYYGIGSSIAFGLNAGFNVLTGRCSGLQDYIGLHKLLKKQLYLMNYFNFLLLVYVICCYFWFGWVYSHNPSLLYWTRVFMIAAYPSMALLFNIDIF